MGWIANIVKFIGDTGDGVIPPAASKPILPHDRTIDRPVIRFAGEVPCANCPIHQQFQAALAEIERLKREKV